MDKQTNLFSHQDLTNPDLSADAYAHLPMAGYVPPGQNNSLSESFAERRNAPSIYPKKTSASGAETPAPGGSGTSKFSFPPQLREIQKNIAAINMLIKRLEAILALPGDLHSNMCQTLSDLKLAQIKLLREQADIKGQADEAAQKH